MSSTQSIFNLIPLLNCFLYSSLCYNQNPTTMMCIYIFNLKISFMTFAPTTIQALMLVALFTPS